MKKFFLLLLLMILVFLQLIWPRVLTFFNLKPDLLLIFVVAAVFFLNFKLALSLSILAGLAKDVFMPLDFGVNTVLFVFWSYLIYKLMRQIVVENVYRRLILILIVAVLNNLFIGIYYLHNGALVPFGIFLRNLIFTSIYTAALAPWVFKLFIKISK